MGLIKATANSIKTVPADQWIDFFYCDAIKEDVLAIKGFKRVQKGSSNTKGTSNYITSDSVIAVADVQCMMIVEQGKIIEVCDEPGEYTFDSDRTQGIFTNESDAAVDLGCNAVIGVDFDYIDLAPEAANSSGGTTYYPYVFCVTANGTAVTIEKE